MPFDQMHRKHEQNKTLKIERSKKKESSVSKKPGNSTTLKDAAKDEKYRSGSVDRKDINRTRGISNPRQARSVDRAQKPVSRVTLGTERNKISTQSKEGSRHSVNKKPIADKVKPPTRTGQVKSEKSNTSSTSLQVKQNQPKSRTPNVEASIKSKTVTSTHSENANQQRSRSFTKSVKPKQESLQKNDMPNKEAEVQPVIRPRTSTIRKGPPFVEDLSQNMTSEVNTSQNVRRNIGHTQLESEIHLKADNADKKGHEKNVIHSLEVEADDDEYSYEDDFEDYDSDFEEESDTYSIDGNESEDDKEQLEEEEETEKWENKSLSDKNRENDSGLLLHPTIFKRHPANALKNFERGRSLLSFINEESSKVDRSVDKTFLRMSDGSTRLQEKDRNKSPSVETMKTSRSFINFATAKQEQLKRKVLNKALKRGQELLEIITFDEVHFDIFDMPPIKYDVYIRAFGKSNTKQVYVQTENYEEEEVQTDDLDVREKWTQHPPSDHKGVGGNIDPINADTGGWKSRFKTDAVQLNNFIQNVGQIVLAVLAEDLAQWSHRQITETAPTIPFSQGLFRLSPVSFCKDVPVTHISFSPVQNNYLLSVHGSLVSLPLSFPSAEEKGIICVWNLHDISSPEYILMASSQPVCACFGPGGSSIVIAGMVDGAVMLWDLRELASSHLQMQLENQEIILRSPTYNTAAILKEDGHHSCVVSVQSVQYSRSHSDLITSGMKGSKETIKTFHVLSLEDMGILIVWVVVEVLEPDRSGSEIDLGLAPGGKIKLVRSSALLLYSLTTLHADLITGIRTFGFQVLPSDLNHVFVTTDAGLVLHVTRHSGYATPKFYSYDGGLSVEIRSIHCSPHNIDLFLVGCSDGSVRLHNMKSERPVMVWPRAAGGEPILHVLWSSVQPTMFYVLDPASNIHMWDLRQSASNPGHSCHFPQARVIWFALNGAIRCQHKTVSDSPSQMAIAKEDGEIEIHAVHQRYDIVPEPEYQRQLHFMQSL